MILQALNDYYGRLAEDEDADVAPPGFSDAGIDFEIILSGQGEVVGIHDVRQHMGNRQRSKTMRVPEAVVRTSGVIADFLWGSSGYVLGVDQDGVTTFSLKKHEAFKELVERIGKPVRDQGLQAILLFLSHWEPAEALAFESWEQMAGKNLVFRLDMERDCVHQGEEVKKAWLEYYVKKGSGEEGQCLVLGDIRELARVHNPIKGVRGAKTSGGYVVSFNASAFTSFGLKGNYNAPVSASAAFNYTTALNRLLTPGSRQKIQIGDATVVFWSKDESEMEELLGMTLSGGQAEDEALNQRLAESLKALKLGVPFAHLDPDNPFFVLGLSPNASRLSVRFWHQSTVGEMRQRLREHLRDLEIIRLSDKQPEHPPLWMLLRETAAQGKDDNIPPLLAGEMARAILTGQAYPRTLLTALVGRLRADKEVGYLRAALVKAYLSRHYRLNETYRNDPRSMEVTVSLDTQSTIPAYRLGRLFATLENLQREAHDNSIVRTIRESYLSSASSAPQSVFPILLKTAQNHYAKLYKKDGRKWLARHLDNIVKEIVSSLTSFPSTLNLEEQGLFFLGYYHQKAHGPAKDKSEQEPADEAADGMED